jgi:hypothetical protein
MSYDSSLITGAEIVQHTGVQDLANLATDAELTLNTFALHAHRAIYRWLEGRGWDPTLISNESRLKDAVAFEAVHRLAVAGYISGEPLGFKALRDEALRDFHPTFSDGSNEPRSADEGLPSVGNFESGWAYGPPDQGSRSSQRFSDDFPLSF